MKSTLALFSCLFAASGLGSAAVVTQWDFNAAEDKLVASLGSGEASLVGGTSASFASDTVNGGSTDPNAVGTGNGGGAWNLTAFPVQSTGSGAAGARFDADTSGVVSFDGVAISFDLRTSNTASRWYQLDYTVNGSDWILGSPTELGSGGNLGDTWHSGQTVVIADTAVLDNPDFAFRVVSVFNPNAFVQVSGDVSYEPNTAYEVARNNGQSTYQGGTWRFDMVTVTAIPEPSVALLGALGALGLLRRRRF